MDKICLLAQLPFYLSGPVTPPNYIWQSPNTSVHIPCLLALTCEQDPEILKLLQLEQRPISNLEEAIYPFLVENHGLRHGWDDFHPTCFTLGCKQLQCVLNRTTLSAISRDATLRFPNQTPSSRQCCGEINKDSSLSSLVGILFTDPTELYIITVAYKDHFRH